MPIAHASWIKYWLQDHDTDYLLQIPPVQNTWYTVFDAEDVRLLWCVIMQLNDEAAAKDLEIRWTCDGTVYFKFLAATNLTNYWIYRTEEPSTGGTDGLSLSGVAVNAAFYADKRALSFKVEARMISVPGTNQQLRCKCVRETLEQTAP